MINFVKYQGAGNDFILIDNRAKQFTGDKVAFAKKYCSRRFGVGSDGVIFIEKSKTADFLMDFYNPDGSQSFCGNGSRCAVNFAVDLNMIEKKAVFEAIDGIHEAERIGENVKIGMHQYGALKLMGKDHFIDTGSPHYISYLTPNDDRAIVPYGKSIRYAADFKEKGTNVNLIAEKGANHIAVQTYERGVEDETLACGTGATACGLSYAFTNDIANGVVNVDVKGGELKIHFEATETEGVYQNIWLEGPAVFVFKGELDGIA